MAEHTKSAGASIICPSGWGFNLQATCDALNLLKQGQPVIICKKIAIARTVFRVRFPVKKRMMGAKYL